MSRATTLLKRISGNQRKLANSLFAAGLKSMDRLKFNFSSGRTFSP